MNQVFTTSNVLRACTLAWLQWLPLGLFFASLTSAKGFRQDGLTWAWIAALIISASIPALALVPQVRSGYERLCRSLVGYVAFPDAKQRRTAERRWFIVWLVVFGATAAPAVFGLGVVISGMLALAQAAGTSEEIIRTVTVAAWTTIVFPIFPVDIRLAELATYWVHLRTQGPRRD